MNSQAVWQKYPANLHTLFSLLLKHNPSISVIVLDEAMNYADYPELAPPMFKAYDIQKNVSMTYKNIRVCCIGGFLKLPIKRGNRYGSSPIMIPYTCRQGEMKL